MKSLQKYQDALLSLGFTALAPLLFLLLLKFGPHFGANYPFNTAPPRIAVIFESIGIPLILVSLAIGMFFGWKNFKSKESNLLGNVSFLAGILMSLLAFFFWLWASGWNG